MQRPPRIPLAGHRELSADEMLKNAKTFRVHMARRRSVRDFSDRPVSRAVIEECVRAAGTAPSGANLQPWHFVIVSDPDKKREIRVAAEAEEREFYAHRATQEWLDVLAPIGTDEKKPFLETAPYLIVIFAERHGVAPDGSTFKTYYAQESVGIATGVLISACHEAGLVTLTHTPSPMKFLNGILGRPENERPFLVLVVGHPADDATVPDIHRKPFDEIATFV